MSKLLEQLESTEAVLLMYIAGELPPGDRAVVDGRLAMDEQWRATLEELRAAQNHFTAGMRASDGETRLSLPEAVAVRRVVGAMRQWQVDRTARPRAEDPRPTLRYPRWAYPVAAAASVMIAFVVWWGNAERPDNRATSRNIPLRIDAGERPSTPDLMAAMIFATSGPMDSTDEFATLVDPTDYAILAPLIEANELGGLPRPEQEPGELEREQDDWYLFL